LLYLFFALGLLVSSVIILIGRRGFWYEGLAILALTISSTQFCFLGHDACHYAIFPRRWQNEAFALLVGNFLVGMSRGWWTHSHNLHHGRPNHPYRDPNLQISFLAFSDNQARSKERLQRFIVRYQALLFIPLISFEAWNLSLKSALFLANQHTKHRMLEIGLFIGHVCLFFAGPFLLFDIRPAIEFVLLYRGLFGLYLGLSFATNHIGMPILDQEAETSFLESQLLVTRNLQANLITDFFFGSLSCQIEHHLFPTLPRKALRQAAKVVREHCKQNHLVYHETGLWQCYCEVFRHLRQIGSACARTEKSKGGS
jgi:fatty acid desaturase